MQDREVQFNGRSGGNIWQKFVGGLGSGVWGDEWKSFGWVFRGFTGGGRSDSNMALSEAPGVDSNIRPIDPFPFPEIKFCGPLVVPQDSVRSFKADLRPERRSKNLSCSIWNRRQTSSTNGSPSRRAKC